MEISDGKLIYFVGAGIVMLVAAAWMTVWPIKAEHHCRLCGCKVDSDKFFSGLVVFVAAVAWPITVVSVAGHLLGRVARCIGYRSSRARHRDEATSEGEAR